MRTLLTNGKRSRERNTNNIYDRRDLQDVWKQLVIISCHCEFVTIIITIIILRNWDSNFFFPIKCNRGQHFDVLQKSISPRALDLRQIFLLHNEEREFLRRESLSRSRRPAGLPARATVPQTRQPFFRQKSRLLQKKISLPPRGNCSRSVSSYQCG